LHRRVAYRYNSYLTSPQGLEWRWKILPFDTEVEAAKNFQRKYYLSKSLKEHRFLTSPRIVPIQAPGVSVVAYFTCPYGSGGFVLRL
jgi:hypothetical protein